MRHTWHHGPSHSSLPRVARKFLLSDLAPGATGSTLHPTRSGSPAHGPDALWDRVRGIPYVKEWKVLNDSLFLVLTFVLGLAWFVSLVTLLAVGFGLVVVWIGMPILAATFALAIWGAQLERSRLRVFL